MSLWISFIHIQLETDTFVLVSGTLRSNLDPFSLHDDARLWDALKRSYLVESQPQAKRASLLSQGASTMEDELPSGAQTPRGGQNRFTLDTIVEDEGNNLSIGQVRLSYSFRYSFVRWLIVVSFCSALLCP